MAAAEVMVALSRCCITTMTSGDMVIIGRRAEVDLVQVAICKCMNVLVSRGHAGLAKMVSLLLMVFALNYAKYKRNPMFCLYIHLKNIIFNNILMHLSEEYYLKNIYKNSEKLQTALFQ